MAEERQVKAWSASKPGAPVEQITYTAPPLRSTEVEVQIKACGVCASDVMLLRSPVEVPPYSFPMVAGHEGVGVVTALGQDVKHLKVGDRVGCGVFRGCCTTCKWCVSGSNNGCPKKQLMFANHSKGCFSDYIRIESGFAFPIPENLPFEHAGPLMCAGVTVFAPFRKHNIKPGDKVGVVGIGGLGHLALQFANKFGCQVYALSSSADKEQEAKGFGAHHFIDTSPNAPAGTGLSSIPNTLDFILMTASGGNLDWKAMINSLAWDGKMVLMGIAHADIPVSPMSLIMGQRSIVGSAAGSSATVMDMLQFASVHGIKPMIQTFPFSSVNDVIDQVKANKVKYRAVLVH